MDKVIQDIDVFTHVAAWVSDQSVGSIVVVIGSVGSDGDDTFQSIDAGGGSGKAQGSVVGSPDHADFTCRPSSFHKFIAIDAGETFGSSVKPIDYGFRCKRFVLSTDRGASLGKPGAG